MTGDRYSRQERFWGIGAEGQARLAAGRVLVVGCGALGSAAIDLLARSGVGRLVVVEGGHPVVYGGAIGSTGMSMTRRRPPAPQPWPQRVRRVDERPLRGPGRAPAPGLPVLW